MIYRMLHKVARMWCTSLAIELFKQAQDAKNHDDIKNGLALTYIAAALNRANGEDVFKC